MSQSDTQIKYDDLVQIEDVLENKFVKPIDFTEEDETANYIIKSLTDFNNSVAVKQAFRYIPYSDFHTGYQNLHLLKNNGPVLPGKHQLENNSLFNILKQMPKGVQQHAHLYTFIDFQKIIPFILKNQQKWDDNLYICTDPNSEAYLCPLMLPKDENKWNYGNCNYENGILTPPVKNIVFTGHTDKTRIGAYAIGTKGALQDKIRLTYTYEFILNNATAAKVIKKMGIPRQGYLFNYYASKKIKDIKAYTTKNATTETNDAITIVLNNMYSPANYAKLFFIKLTNDNFMSLCETRKNKGKDGRSVLCQNVSHLFPDCESVPNCIYEMFSFSQPFYDLWINMFVRQSVFESGQITEAIAYYKGKMPADTAEKAKLEKILAAAEAAITQERDKDFYTKWDLLERTTEIGGSLAKYCKIFPFFFSLTLLNAYYDDNLRILELRTPLGNIYKNQIIDGKLEKRVRITSGDKVMEPTTTTTNPLPPDSIYSRAFNYLNNNNDCLKNLNYGDVSWTDEKDKVKTKKSLYAKFDNGLYQFTMMEIVSYITNLCIIQRELQEAAEKTAAEKEAAEKAAAAVAAAAVAAAAAAAAVVPAEAAVVPAEAAVGPAVVPTIVQAEQPKPYYKHLERLVTAYKAKQVKTYTNARAAGFTSCLTQGSKFNNVSGIIDKILGKIYNATYNIDFDTLTKGVLNETPPGGKDLITPELTKLGFTNLDKIIGVCKLKEQEKTLPIKYTIIGATGKQKLVSKVDCRSTLLDILYIFLISSFFQDKQHTKENAEENLSFIYRRRIQGFDLYGEEDLHHTDSPYERLLIFFREYAIEKKINWTYFLHAGENHNYIENNSNLFLAILLDTKRIGHGLRIIGSQSLIELVKSKGICVECCPISNQLLDYTTNLSFHPALYYINNNIDVSISSDDPNLYGYDSLAYDFTSIVNAWNLDLVQLKKLVKTSIKYASTKISHTFIKEFDDAWRNWIVTFYNNEYVNLGELIEKLIVVEFIKLKTAFTPQDVYKSRITELQTVYNTYADSNPDKAKTDEAKKTDVSLFTDYLTGTFVENIKTFYGKAECSVAIEDFFNTDSWYTKCKADITKDTPDDVRSSCSTTDALIADDASAATPTGDGAPAPTGDTTPPGADAIADAAPIASAPTGDTPTVIADGNASASNAAAPTSVDTTDAAALADSLGAGGGGGKNKTIKHRRKTNKYTMRNYLRNKTTIKKNRHRYHNNTIKK